VSPDRDRILEQAVTQELRGRAATPGEACIDAETLAAWTDGTLDAVTVAAMEAHASSCGRCQELIGAMARTLPATPASTTHGSEARGAVAWWKWLVPISAAAAAAVIWMVVPGQRQLVVAPAQPPAADRPAQDTLARSRADSAQPASPAPAASEARANKPAPSEPPASPAKEKDQKLAETAALADTVTVDRDQSRAKDAAKAEQPAMANAAPTPVPAAPAAAPAARQEAFATRSLDQQAKRSESAVVDVASPDARRRWRVVADSIERTDNGGQSWTMVHLLRGESIAGGSSPSTTVCWFVGPGGVVMITVDANLFVHVDVPGRPDLRSVTATDARSAVVTASDGRSFHTGDSGRTWHEN